MSGKERVQRLSFFFIKTAGKQIGKKEVKWVSEENTRNLGQVIGGGKKEKLFRQRQWRQKKLDPEEGATRHEETVWKMGKAEG